MPPRIGPGPLLALLGAALLLISLFLDWFATGGDAVERGLNGWTVFEVLDLVLALAALAAILIALRRLGVGIAPGGGGGPGPGRLDLSGPVLPALGAVALVVVVSQLVNHPPSLGVGERLGAVEVSPEEGAWLALVGAVLLTLGGLLSVAGLSVALQYGSGGPGGPGGPGAWRGRGPGAAPGPPGEPTHPPTEPGPAEPPGAQERPPGAQERPPGGPV